ncbi:MAG: aldehyde dehydrogenase family protein, partial [Faecalibacterium sp.]|nr:aldehyde dehydrogenase family protein [Faecalibacterium sp.]
MELEAMLQSQRDYFAAGNTLPPFARVEMLKKLRDESRRSEAEIAAALQADLNKCGAESYMTEIGMVLDELGCLIKNTARWAKPKRARTPLAQFAAKSYVVQQPYGCTLIMAPW